MSPALLVERLRATAQKLGDQADAIEEAGRLPGDVIDELRESGVFRAFVPSRYGGLKSPFLPVLEGLTELGEACASSCWVASLAASHGLIAAWFPEAAQDSVWGEGPDALIGSSLAPMGKLTPDGDGYSLSGDWSYSSGIDHADWLILGAQDEQNCSFLVLVPAGEVTVREDWKVIGLQGTGSHSLSLSDARVPSERVVAMADLEAGETPGHLVNRAGVFRFPWRPAFSFSFVPTALGVARSALAVSRIYFKEKRSAYTGKEYSENPVGWVQLAESAAEVEAAFALTRLNVSEIDECLNQGRQVPAGLTVRASYAPAQVVRLCRQAVTRLFHLSGARVLFRDATLQRNFRDIQALGQHPGVNLDIAGQAYGRALLESDFRVGERFDGGG